MEEGDLYNGLFLTDKILHEEFKGLVASDDKYRRDAIDASSQMKVLPPDELDDPVEIKFAAEKGEPDGPVNRRAPLNPVASPLLGKYRRMEGREKVPDPALTSVPLQGKLILMIFTSTVLFWVFVQATILNKSRTGKYLVPMDENPMGGPSGEVLDELGGLNTNLIREGEIVRVFWAMWMHSGYIHIIFNLIVQILYLYMIEPDWGFWRTAFLFWISGLTGNILSAICTPCIVTVGSSGAMFGLMGGIIAYTIEYWKTIPRAWCLLITSLVVMAIGITMGVFEGGTDNWAHIGGACGGIFFGFGTIRTLAACEDCGGDKCQKCSRCCKSKEEEEEQYEIPPDEKVLVIVGTDGRKRKKMVKRKLDPKTSKERLQPACAHGVQEWLCRVFSWLCLFAVWFCGWWFLLEDYEFQPLPTLGVRGACCCCYINEESLEHEDFDLLSKTEKRASWKCYPCDSVPPELEDITMDNYCLNNSVFYHYEYKSPLL